MGNVAFFAFMPVKIDATIFAFFHLFLDEFSHIIGEISRQFREVIFVTLPMRNHEVLVMFFYLTSVVLL